MGEKRINLLNFLGNNGRELRLLSHQRLKEIITWKFGRMEP